MSSPIILYASDIVALDNISIKTAYNRIKKIRQSFGLDPKKPITIFHYAKYYQLEVEQLIKFMNKMPKRPKSSKSRKKSKS